MAAFDATLPLRTLVVDDNHDAAETLARLVELQGDEVRIAYDGAAALEEAQVYEPDVGLIDLQIPQLDGFRLAKRLRDLPRLHDMLLVAVTGFADRAHRTLAQEAGFDKYLVKPFSLSQLKEVLRMARVTREITAERRAASQELRHQSEALRGASAAVASQSRELQDRSSKIMQQHRREELEQRLAVAPWQSLLSAMATDVDCRGDQLASDCWCAACVRRTIDSILTGESVSDELVLRLLKSLQPLVESGG